MGQYQQWLLAQEIDRRLKAEVETLETELLYLKDRIAILEQAAPQTENVILRALQAYLRGQVGVESGWSGLPSPETPRLPFGQQVPYASLPSSQMGPAPKDMRAFFDQREQTHSTLPPPWLQLNRAAETGGTAHGVDAETRRLNENIQRWFERWHRESNSIEQPEGVKNE